MQIKITVQFCFHLQIGKILTIISNADVHAIRRAFSYTADRTINWN